MILTEQNNYKKICAACGLCNGSRCTAFQKKIVQTSVVPQKIPETYSNGIRFTSDAMDCALPISVDSHSGCTYSCLYCFANNLMRAPDRNLAKFKKQIASGNFYTQWPLKHLEAMLDGTTKSAYYRKFGSLIREQGFPVQVGALGDPCDDLELASGWLKKALPVFFKYNVPVRISTKGAKVLLRRDYRKIFAQRPELVWIAFSIISNSDELISKVDINAPVTSERIAAMRAYSKMGIKTSLRFRPFLPGISDSYPGEPNAWRTLLERCATAGACAVSFEWIFLNASPTERQRAMYQLMFRAQGKPKFADEWNAASDLREACRRGNRAAKYQMTVNIRQAAHEFGLTFGCSDPHFKELNDTGCCCGIKPNDEFFGGWSRRQLTNVIFEMAKAHAKGKKPYVTYLDWAPQWAHDTKAHEMFATGGWHDYRKKRDMTFGDAMRNKWNRPMSPRSPFVYFEGVMRPVGLDKATGDVVYTYRPWYEGYQRDKIKEKEAS